VKNHWENVGENQSAAVPKGKKSQELGDLKQGKGKNHTGEERKEQRQRERSSG